MFIKRMPKFGYHAPKSLTEAVALLSKYNKKARVFAGGTDLFVAMKKRETVPEHLVNLKAIEDLRGIHYDAASGLRIGGLTPLGDLERSKIVDKKFSILRDALDAQDLGTPLADFDRHRMPWRCSKELSGSSDEHREDPSKIAAGS